MHVSQHTSHAYSQSAKRRLLLGQQGVQGVQGVQQDLKDQTPSFYTNQQPPRLSPIPSISSHPQKSSPSHTPQQRTPSKDNTFYKTPPSNSPKPSPNLTPQHHTSLPLPGTSVTPSPHRQRSTPGERGRVGGWEGAAQTKNGEFLGEFARVAGSSAIGCRVDETERQKETGNQKGSEMERELGATKFTHSQTSRISGGEGGIEGPTSRGPLGRLFDMVKGLLSVC
jgi:hypothetical protein